MKTTQLTRLFPEIQHRFVYLPTMLIRCISPFTMNLLIATFFLVLFDAAAIGNLDLLYRGLWQTSLLLGVLIVVWALANYYFDVSVLHTTANFRRKVFAHIQRLPFDYTQEHHSGDLISRLTNDIKTMEGAYGETLRGLLGSLIGGVASLIIMFTTNWQLAAMVSGFGLVCVLINTRFLKPLHASSTQVQANMGKLTEALSDVLASASVTRMFGLQHVVSQNFRDQNNQVLKSGTKRVQDNALLNSINYITSFLGFSGIMIVGGYFVLQGSASFGETVFMVQMQNMVNGLFQNIGNQLTQLQTAFAGADRIYEILETQAEPIKYDMLNTTSMIEGAVVLENVSFSYDNRENVLQNVNITVPTGSILALVGNSGGGKSTVLKLLLGLYPPTQGDIQVEELKLSQCQLADLRNKIAYVPQDSYLFSGTIAENIQLGNPGAGQELIEQAAKDAYAHEFIMQLPNGYQTLVGERGAHLSGGQRQRISIARALLKNAPILLLDEATSALDTESEKIVQQALQKLMHGRTTIVVAHRLATIKQADNIVVIDHGQIMEQGTHQHLLALPQSRYKQLYELQYKQTVSVA